MRRRLPALLASALLIAACGESQQPEPPANSKTGGAQANAQGLDELGVEPAGDGGTDAVPSGDAAADPPEAEP